jgi:hypothetical protein
MSWQPWTFTDPFIAYTPIRAEEMNPNLNGISASFNYVANELDKFRPRMPSNFNGNIEIQDSTYISTLLGVDENGNMSLIDQSAFKAASDKDFTIKKSSDQQFTISGDNHADWFMLNYEAVNDENIVVVVGPAITNVDGVDAAAPATTIIFTQDSATPLIFAPVDGVTIKSPGLLKAYGQNSTVTLIAVDQYTWVLGGDVLPAEAIV